MFDHRKYLTKWLITPDLSDAARYNIVIEPVPNLTPGALYWRIIGVHHLLPEENGGKHNLFLQTLTKAGEILTGVVAWGWEGQRPGENSPKVSLDKPDSEPGGNIGIYWAQNVWAKVSSVHPSELVRNVNTRHLDEGQGNTLGHHSFYVAWQLTQHGDEPEPPEEPPTEPGEGDRLPGFLAALKALIAGYE